MRLIKITYEIVTPESAEQGDIAESGWIDEEGTPVEPDEFDIEEMGEPLAVAKCAAKIIGHCVEASDYPKCHPGHTWYTDADGDTDYSTGAVTRQSYHLEGFSEEEEVELYAELTGRVVKQ